MLLVAIEASNMPAKDVRLLQVAMGNAVEKLEDWKKRETQQRRDMHLELQSHLLIHRNFLDTLEFFKRKLFM